MEDKNYEAAGDNNESTPMDPSAESQNKENVKERDYEMVENPDSKPTEETLVNNQE
jgi:hypothetical protein